MARLVSIPFVGGPVDKESVLVSQISGDMRELSDTQYPQDRYHVLRSADGTPWLLRHSSITEEQALRLLVRNYIEARKWQTR